MIDYENMDIYELASLLNKMRNDELLIINIGDKQYQPDYLTVAPGEIIIYTKPQEKQ